MPPAEGETESDLRDGVPVAVFKGLPRRVARIGRLADSLSRRSYHPERRIYADRPRANSILQIALLSKVAPIEG